MRNSYVVLLLILSLSASGATYYVDPAGSNNNNGTAGSPWKTLAFACSKVKTSGDIIHLNSGTFIETSQSLLAVGVSIEGEGDNSVIQSRVGGSSFTILLTSSTQAANGNQHISNIKMDGDNLTAYGAIRVAYRKNVEIYNCTFVNFNYYGVSFINGEPPTIYATGNKFYNNTVTNCSGWYSGNRGCLEIQGQDGMLIYNNNMSTEGRKDTGDVIYAVEGFLKNVKIYNNTFVKDYYPGISHNDFALEFWNCQGGVEIYDNEITGSIDIVRSSEKNGNAYCVWIHDNRLGQDVLMASEYTRGVLLESYTPSFISDIIVEKNYIKNVAQGIFIHGNNGDVCSINNVRISCNIFTNIGANISSKGWGIYWSVEDNIDKADNIDIFNNVITAQSGSYTTMYGIGLPTIGTATNVRIRNNIIVGFDNSPIYASGSGSATIRILSIENNLFYGNGNSNAIRYVNGIVPSSNTTQNNIIGNPLFVSSSNFHLQSGSPAIGKGLSISGLSSDYDGNSFNSPPSIGACEYGSSVASPDLPVYQSSVVEQATPSLVEMTYSISLANVVPSASAFSVLVNSKSRTVSKVAVSGTSVQLTLSSPVVFGDALTVSYTKPSSNQLQSASGGQAATIRTQTVTNKVTTVNPVYVSSVIENATPSLLEMTYNLTLANVVSAVSAFSVLVNSRARTVNKVAISGTRVQLTLASPVIYGDVVTVSYTKPSTTPLQATNGGQAPSISAQTVTNKVASLSPVYVSSAIENATPALLVMNYDQTLANIVPAASAFVVRVNSTTRTVNKVAVSGTRVQLTLASNVVYGDVVTVAYTKPSKNPLQTASKAQAATISAQAVTNKVNALIPTYISSVVENATPSLLEMTYNIALANKVPSSSSFTVKVNSTTRAVTKVTISGTKVHLTLGSPVLSGDIVTISYTKPASNPLQTATGVMAGNIVNKSVNNNCGNIAPEVVITSPLDNTLFSSPADITITADASDSDGSVTLVEFYNGDTKLGSKSDAPYSFDWNNVGDGIYSLTAIVTDNENAKTTSSAISITVTSETDTINQPPVVTISNPTKGIQYDDPASIDIKVVATDPDGTISKVLLFNGSKMLVELTSAPYLYTWKDMKAGNYSIKAVAYDNFNATATSSLIEFKVGGGPVYDADSEIINLYPNPNNGNFSIEILKPFEDEKCKIVITDLGGKQISNVPILEEGTLMHFDMSYIKSGIYIMMVIGKGILVTKKFIKY